MRFSGLRRRRVLFTTVGLALLIGLAYGTFSSFAQRGLSAASKPRYSLVTPHHGVLDASVDASGSLQPRQVVNLGFNTPGVVADVMVQVGDTVEKGAPLARLDTSDLELRVEQAQAALDQTQAGYKKLLQSASPADVEQARAQLEQAQAQLRQTRGNITEQDIAAARAQLDEARARLAQFEAGPASADQQAAQASLDQANAALQSQRDSLSAAKTTAQSQMEQAANALRDRQAEYNSIYWGNRQLASALGQPVDALPSFLLDREAAALRAVQSADQTFKQAQVAYEQARQAEITGVAAAEAQVHNAQASLDKLSAGAPADQLAAARAQVAQAQASLDKLQGEQRAGSLDAASAGVQSAQANVKRLAAGPDEADLEGAQGQIHQAEVVLKQAQLALNSAVLRSPIAGTVAEVNLAVGETSNGPKPAIVLADLSHLHVDGNVDEIDVTQIAVGQAATVTLDALSDLALAGKVSLISPLSVEQSGVSSYKVRVELQTADARIHPGMAANVEIVVARKNNVLVVPRRAVRLDQGKLLVDLPTNQSLCGADQSTWPQAPELHAVEVTTGLSNDETIELTSGNIAESTCIYIEGLDPRLNILESPTPERRAGS